ncbi:tRNA lysidine(34) synthetase TilS [Desulfotomaculum sp. 1211_IL3151]|uniref:tRNA lysidine(34) synthetase TilS n=1 Tax=Desulfotomaculum sp. 1211_IL3151 TaxID=3084055 RepID=UPI002FDB2DA2
MEVLERVYTEIARHKMVTEGQRVIVGVSGGPDSVVLLHILYCLEKRLGISLYAAHLNHMFRGEEAKGDALFVQAICSQWGIPCISEERDVPAYARCNGLSSQVAARELRYQFFCDVLHKAQGHKIALAHHANDQAESVLMNIFRGSGLKGLGGIAPMRDNLYIRPLLKIRRDEIEQYCQQHGLSYRIDSSNLKTKYRRNKLRHHLIPLLEKDYAPGIVAILSRMADQIREEDEFLEGLAYEMYQKVLLDMNGSALVLNRKELMNQSTVLLRRIIRIAYQQLHGTKQGIAFEHVDNLINHLKRGGAERMIEMPAGIKVRLALDRVDFSKDLIGSQPTKASYQLELPGSVTIENMKVSTRIMNKDEMPLTPQKLPLNMAAIDYHRVAQPLEVRFRQAGDVFIPFGLGRKVKLKKFMIDRKIPKHLRDKIPLIVEKDSQRIIWVAGIRLADHIGLTSLTQKVILLSLESGNNSNG